MAIAARLKLSGSKKALPERVERLFILGSRSGAYLGTMSHLVPFETSVASYLEKSCRSL